MTNTAPQPPTTDEPTTTPSPRTVAATALPILRQLKAHRTQWEEDARAAARDGFRPHYCEHGTNLWTDYDPICGPCEDGWTLYQIATSTARAAIREAYSRMDASSALIREHGRTMPPQLLEELIGWTLAPIKDATR